MDPMGDKSPITVRTLRLQWRLVTDRVMGGVSLGEMSADQLDGEPCVCMRGRVSTCNNGGFVQLLANLSPSDIPGFDQCTGLRLRVRGNGETYNAHLKTADLEFPWQSYRQSFIAPDVWSQVRLPFSDFAPHRTRAPLHLGSVTRLGLVAIGRDFTAELCLASLCIY